MKKAFLAIAAVALLFATSCTKENNAPENPTLGDGEFLATIDEGAYPQNAPVVNDGMSPKTTIDANRYVIWEAGDEIKINGSIYTTNTSGNTVVFAPSDPKETHKVGQTFHAFFPASIAGTDNAGTLPATQTIVDGKVSNLPMYAYSTDRQLTFHNICAALKITVPVACDEIRVNASTNLCGAFTVNNNVAELSDKTGSNNNTITVAGPFNENQVVYVAVPAGTYNDFKVTMYSDSAYSVPAAQNIQLEANKIYGVSFTPATDCFHFEAIDAGATIKMTTQDNVSGLTTPQLEYSTDGYIWNSYSFNTLLTMSNAGDKVYFRAPVSHPNSVFANADGAYIFATTDGAKKVKVAGNIMTLLNGTNPPTDFGGHSYVFRRLMSWCNNIYDASGLILPDVTAPYCYSSMFQESRLHFIPNLPALVMSERCYENMFFANYYLETSPIVLPATTLADYCYYRMLGMCTTGDQTLPEVHIKATDYTNSSYSCSEIFYSTHRVTKVYFYTSSFPTNNNCVKALFANNYCMNNPVVYYLQGANINDVWNSMTQFWYSGYSQSGSISNAVFTPSN